MHMVSYQLVSGEEERERMREDQVTEAGIGKRGKKSEKWVMAIVE